MSGDDEASWVAGRRPTENGGAFPREFNPGNHQSTEKTGRQTGENSSNYDIPAHRRPFVTSDNGLNHGGLSCCPGRKASLPVPQGLQVNEKCFRLIVISS